MATTTISVELDEQIRLRLESAADQQARTPDCLVKQMILAGLKRLELGEILEGAAHDDGVFPDSMPLLGFAQDAQLQTVLRAAITAAYRRPEEDCIPALVTHAALPAKLAATVQGTAKDLVMKLRAKRPRGIVEPLLQEYALSSREGVALMCLAEALLRIPDSATRDALIRDKIGSGNWRIHLGGSRSLFVNAATWGLLLTGKLAAANSEVSLSSALTKLIVRGGESVVRGGMHIAMRLMGEQFVVGQSLAEALANSRKWEAKGFCYSYDMLGESALTAEDAARYLRDYEQAIHAIGKAARGCGIYKGSGISIKLSALHPRYTRAQRERVMTELLPRLAGLAKLARGYDIGLNIDAEEADRLELSLDLLEILCFDPAMGGWNGIGFVVQAYQKRAPFVLDFLIDLAHRAKRRIMVRLVKGAYWDSEIKRAQIDGLEGYPVFTRKVHTDVSYLACARKLLAAPDAVFPQFATHNAHTVASIHAMAGKNFYEGQYEFQCLHGMGEPLYGEVVGARKLNRPCRIYAPVGTHETLLAYLVRRLLENGANTSFVHKIADPKVSLDDLIADPVAEACKIVPLGAPHEKIALPVSIFGAARRNSLGFDLSNEQRLASLASAMFAGFNTSWHASPILAAGPVEGQARPVLNPADLRDKVGSVVDTLPHIVDAAFIYALEAAPVWRSTPPQERAAVLNRAADLLESRLPSLTGLIVREAGKTMPAAISEVREAVDYLRYYAAQIMRDFGNDTHRPLGPVVAISPWNFPLAIFMGQVAAALAAGNVVLAKPAEETPLIAATAVNLLLEAGVPSGVVQMLPGDGAVGAALVADDRVRGVLFTGSTEVARAIQQQLAARLDARGLPIPLIAETGGQNAMVVDSSALPEQAVADIIASAFDSAGQRCSALRILLVQDDIAPKLIDMLHGAMEQLVIGRPDHLAADIGPLINEPARQAVSEHIASMRQRGYPVFTLDLSASCAHGNFVPPAVVEIPSIDVLGREVFGPVLHVLRYKRAELNLMIEAVNALGYGLTFGIHSRIDETIALAINCINSGNIYVNRNIIGAVVGVQPFGGYAFSGTGPKAGGALYLRRLLAERPAIHNPPMGGAPEMFHEFIEFLSNQAIDTTALSGCADRSPLQTGIVLPGPAGEQNQYRLMPRGRVLCCAKTQDGALRQIAASLATGNKALVIGAVQFQALRALPASLARYIEFVTEIVPADVALYEGDAGALCALMTELAKQPHAMVPVYALSRDGCRMEDYPLEFLLVEQAVSVNTAAAGGNVSLMMIG